MDAIPLSLLFSSLLVLILLSAFFSGSETAHMTLNRYRLRHLAECGHGGALHASRLLEIVGEFTTDPADVTPPSSIPGGTAVA